MKLLAVDHSSVFRRYWEAAEGKDFGEARRRTLSTVEQARHEFGADRVVLAIDRSPSFRKLYLPAYKSDRTDPGAPFREQIKLTANDLVSRGALLYYSPVLLKGKDGADMFGEADDVIASLALWYQETRGEDWALRILSSDTDLWALVDDELAIDLFTLEGKRITVHEVTERYGVAPFLVPEHKALCGDNDGYKPFANPEKNEKGGAKPGIGPTTATQILLSTAERQDGDRSAADAVVRAVLAGATVDVKLNAAAIACIKHGGLSALELGRKMAQLHPLLAEKDGKRDVLDFQRVVDGPVVSKAEPPPSDAGHEAAPDAPTSGHLAEPAAPPPTPVVFATQTSPQTALVAHRDPTVLAPYALEPNTMQQAFWLAEQAAKSGLYAKRLPNQHACMMAIVDARTLGVPAAVALRHAHFVKGAIGWSAMFIMGLVKRSALCVKLHFRMSECNAQQSVLVFQRAGEPEDRKVFTIKDAQSAGWVRPDGPWTTRPEVMLCWANGRETARRVWFDIVGGMYGPDELARGTVDDGGELPHDMVSE